MSLKMDEIKEKITDASIKVVSFDIFDTLLLRPVVSPTDLFKIVGIRGGIDKQLFQTMRIHAEKEARRCKSFNLDDITLDEIYIQLIDKFGISHEKAEELKKIELEVEKHYLYRRKSVGELFDAAKQAGKKVIIVSDMYLPKKFIEEVLYKNHYTGYDNLYLSCEYKVSKGTGKLYNVVIEDYKKEGISANEIIHIGDNQGADIQKAIEHGMQTEYIPSAISIFRSKREYGYLLRLLASDMDDSFLVGYWANKLFDDGYTEFPLASVINGNINNFSGLFSSMFISFVKWMLSDMECNNINNLLLVYRDGYMIENILNIFKKYFTLPNIKKIYLPRKLRMNYELANFQNVIYNIINFPPNPSMTLEEFITNRLLISNIDKQQAFDIFLENGYTSSTNEIGNIDRYITFIHKLEPLVEKSAIKKKVDIEKYCKEILDSVKEEIAVFDVGYRGSVSRFLKNNMNINNRGYHLFANYQIDINRLGKYNLLPYISYGMSTPVETIILHALVEDILCAREGSVVDLQYENDSYVLYREDYNEIPEIAVLQSQIITYISDFLDLFHCDFSYLEFGHYLEFDLLVRMLKRPFKDDAYAIGNLSFRDSAFLGKKDNIYKVWCEKFYPTIYGENNELTKVNLARNQAISFIKKVHLEKPAKKMYYSLKEIYSKKAERYKQWDNWENLISATKESINFLKSQELLKNKKNIVIFGDMVSFDKGVCQYLNKLSEEINKKGYNLVLLSEAVLASDEVHKNKIKFASLKVPFFLGKNQYKRHCKINIPNDIKEKIISEEYLVWAIKNWTKRHKDMDISYAEAIAYVANNYYTQAFDFLKPYSIIMWNQFHALHHIIKGIADIKKIKPFYMEFGSIPGTFAFEDSGQMGESYPAINYKEFTNFKLSEDDIKNGKNIWRYLESSKLNRNEQNTSIKSIETLELIDKKKPIVLFAGQNDFESGLYPYDEHTKKYHSPIFKSSYNALLFLSDLAHKNNWNLIYKPHPIMKLLNSENKKIPSNIVVVSDIDINDIIDFADVTITILSQTGYISTIRRKATVMLGYTQLKGKDCTYEAFDKEEVESVVISALNNGFTKKQEIAFEKHLSQMLKYYLFDDMLNREIRYGQGMDKFIEVLLKNS